MHIPFPSVKFDKTCEILKNNPVRKTPLYFSYFKKRLKIVFRGRKYKAELLIFVYVNNYSQLSFTT
jgi:hypothetical protein